MCKLHYSVVVLCIAGPTGPSVAGYLTAGTRSTMPDKPPPVDHHDDLLQ